MHVTPTETHTHTFALNSHRDRHRELPDITLHTFLCRVSCGNLLPELGDSAGEVRGVCQTVVGKAFVCVPGVIAALPRQLLHTQTYSMHEQKQALGGQITIHSFCKISAAKCINCILIQKKKNQQS